MFVVHPTDGDTTSCSTFTLNDSTGTKVFLDGQRIRAWYLVSTDRTGIQYSNVVAGTYVPIYSGEMSGSFKNGQGEDTIGWFKSLTGTLTLYVIFIY